MRAARAKALAEEARVVRANARKKRRRNTLNELNVLGEEVGVQAISFARHLIRRSAPSYDNLPDVVVLTLESCGESGLCFWNGNRTAVR